MKKMNLAFFSILFIVIFLYGFVVGNYNFFPFEIMKDLKNTLFPNNLNLNQNSPIPDITVESYIKLKNQNLLYEKRQNLIDFIWKQNGFPENKQPDIEENISDDRYDNFSNMKSIHKITSEMDYGVTSVAYLFEAESSNDELIIYHQGHRGDFVNGKKTIEYFLEHGYSVLAFSMPLMGMNNQPVIHTENFGPILLSSHNKLKFLENSDFTPIKFFVEPIAVSLNYVNENFDFKKYHIVGISGGGWTAVLYSAIDERIANTYSVAGSLPIFLRTNSADFGDYEQTNTSLLSIANYLELYVMSSFGDDRKTTLIYNKFDPCCFAGNSSLIFLEPVKKTISDLEKGDFDIIIDDTTKEHDISNHTLELILESLQNNLN